VLAKVEPDHPTALFFDLLGPLCVVLLAAGVQVEKVVADEHIALNTFKEHGVDYPPFDLHNVVVKRIVPFSDELNDGASLGVIHK
jgi:hypothetical protein